MKNLPLSASAGILAAAGNALATAATSDAPSLVITLSTLVGALVTCLVWVIRHVLGAHERQTAQICQSFERAIRHQEDLLRKIETGNRSQLLDPGP